MYNILIFRQVRAVNDHARAGDRQREERLTHRHDPCARVQQILPLRYEQVFVAFDRIRQEGYADSNNDEQDEECGHHHLVDLFNAAGHAEDQHSRRQQDNQGVPRHTGKIRAAHFREELLRFGAHQRAGQCTECAPQHPADDDGVADGNTERAEQRNRTEDGAALFTAGLHRKFIRADRTCAGHTAEGELAGQADIAEQCDKQQVGD